MIYHMLLSHYLGQTHRLYREPKIIDVISDPQNPTKFISYINYDLENFLLSHHSPTQDQTKGMMKENKQIIIHVGMWRMYFDGTYKKRGNGAIVLLKSPLGRDFPHSFKLKFMCTNNVVEYEVLILGLETIRKMGIKQLNIFGDLHVIVNQIKEICQSGHPRMKQYKRIVWDLSKNFFHTINIFARPRELNHRVDNFANIVVEFTHEI